MIIIWLAVFLIPFTIGLSCTEDCENGYCDEKGFCRCYPGYYNSDCSYRVCPFGEALQVSPLGDLNGDGVIDKTRVRTELYPNGMGIKEWDENDTQDRPHSYRECSNAGKCNRLTGLCKCNEGFEGSACQRRKCRPNDSVKDCNGNGICVSSDDYIKIATGGEEGSNSWELKKYNRCLCDKGWKGVYCDKRVCNKGYDPKYYQTLFQFAYTLLDSSENRPTDPPNGNGGTISHYLEFNYYGMKYKTPTIDSYEGLCSSSSPYELNVDLGILFKEELKKKLRHLPYFTPVNITLICSGDKKEEIDGSTKKIKTSNTYQDGNFVTVILTLDYIDITPILMMELNVYKNGSKDNALLYGIERAKWKNDGSGYDNDNTYGSFQSTASQAVWLMKYRSLIDDKAACYSNHRLTANNFPSFPLDIKGECNSGGKYSIYFAPNTDPLGFPVQGQLECSGKGICDESKGICECYDNYYGSACNRIANY